MISMLKEVYRNEGLAGLYRGWAPVIESLFCSNFVYFYTFHGLKRVANTDGSVIKDLLLAMVAGSVNVLSTTPLWVVNTRMKMQGAKVEGHQSHEHRKYKGLIDGLFHIGRNEGVEGLWSGTLSSLILVINPAIQFMAYEAMKRRLGLLYGDAPLNSTTVFFVGAAAKALATIITYPIQLVQAKQRHGHSYEGLPQKAGAIRLISYIIKNFGFKGLFKGLEAKILQTVLTAALMFVAYEKIAAVVFAVLMGRSRSNLKN